MKDYPSRIYVPNSGSNTVNVIDPATYKIIGHFRVGRQPQHVTPSYDLKTLWVLNDLGDSVTKIDPATGKKGKTIRVEDPYNMYYTPDGKYAIVVAERKDRLDFVNPQTMKLEHALSVPCRGVDHMDFSADGRYLIASCEFSGTLVKVDVAKQSLIGELKLPRQGMPQDVKLSPDGTIFYVADMDANGVYEVDGDVFKVLGFIPTGKGAHGLYTSRDSRVLYVSNRGEGTISLIGFAERRVVDKVEAPRTEAAPTWEESPPTARFCGCRDAIIAKSTPSILRTAVCWPALKSVKAPTGYAFTRSPAATPSATPAFSVSVPSRLIHYGGAYIDFYVCATLCSLESGKWGTAHPLKVPRRGISAPPAVVTYPGMRSIRLP